MAQDFRLLGVHSHLHRAQGYSAQIGCRCLSDGAETAVGLILHLYIGIAEKQDDRPVTARGQEGSWSRGVLLRAFSRLYLCLPDGLLGCLL